MVVPTLFGELGIEYRLNHDWSKRVDWEAEGSGAVALRLFGPGYDPAVDVLRVQGDSAAWAAEDSQGWDAWDAATAPPSCDELPAPSTT